MTKNLRSIFIPALLFALTVFFFPIPRSFAETLAPSAPLNFTFDADVQGFTYQNGLYQGTTDGTANGTYSTGGAGNCTSPGCLKVTISGNTGGASSGGWKKTFDIGEPLAVTVSFNWSQLLSGNTELSQGESNRIYMRDLATGADILVNTVIPPGDTVVSDIIVQGTKSATFNLAAGTYAFDVGFWQSMFSSGSEYGTLWIDNVSITAASQGGQPSDTAPPSVSVSSPSSGATVSGAITVSASASDNTGISGVQFKLDGSNLGSEDTASPYGTTWDTTAASNGTHSLTATARDAAGNQTTSAPITVTVNNATADTSAPSAPGTLSASAVSSSQINLSWTASTDNTGVAGYRIYRNSSQIATTAATSYQDSNLAASTSYTYTVQAYDAAGNSSSQSSQATATTQSASQPPPSTGIYYFSDCATGGSGTIGDPWCLDPDVGGSTLKRSFEHLVDGTAPEAAAGNTIYLCAGPCDGTGSGTFYLEGHVSGGTSSGYQVAVDANVSGSSAAWITVQAYPGETVIISGDSNANNAYDAGEPGTFFLNQQSQTGFSGHSFWRFRNFTIEKFAGRAVEIQRLDTGKEIEFDNMTLRYIGAGVPLGFTVDDTEAWYAPITGDGGPVAMNCNMDDVSSRIDKWNLFWYAYNRGSLLRVKNSRMYQSCAAMLRINNNCFNANGDADYENCTNPGGVSFEDNTVYAMGPVVNGHQGGNWTFKRNTIYDVEGGISAEEHVRNITIEDNDISCRGTYQVRPNGNCNGLIKIVDGDGAGDCSAVDQPDPCQGTQCACSTHTVSIKRNKVWSAATAAGKTNALIVFNAHNVTGNAGGGVNTVIENNILWGQLSSFGCFPDSAGSTDYYRAGEYALSVVSEDPVVIRNNTIRSNKCSALIRSGFSGSWGGTAAVAHTIDGNIFIDMSDKQALRVESSAGGSMLRDNIFHQGAGSASNALYFNGTTYACSVGSFPGTNNRCVQPSFVNVGGAKNTWDLHLAANDVEAKDRMTSGISPANDIDSQVRPQNSASDIGADELVLAGSVSDTTPPTIPTGLTGVYVALQWISSQLASLVSALDVFAADLLNVLLGLAR